MMWNKPLLETKAANSIDEHLLCSMRAKHKTIICFYTFFYFHFHPFSGFSALLHFSNIENSFLSTFFSHSFPLFPCYFFVCNFHLNRNGFWLALSILLNVKLDVDNCNKIHVWTHVTKTMLGSAIVDFTSRHFVDFVPTTTTTKKRNNLWLLMSTSSCRTTTSISMAFIAIVSVGAFSHFPFWWRLIIFRIGRWEKNTHTNTLTADTVHILTT